MKDFWDARYTEAGFAYGTRPNDFLAELADRVEGPVLCIAEGEGRNSVFLAERGHEVHAVDYSPVGVRKTLALAAARGVTVHASEGDLADADLGRERFGTVVSIFAHFPPPVRAGIHRKVVDALRPGGLLILEGYTPAHLDAPGVGGPPARPLLYDRPTLEADFAGLALEIAELDREIEEGAYHRGLSSVIQLIGRKD